MCAFISIPAAAAARVPSAADNAAALTRRDSVAAAIRARSDGACAPACVAAAWRPGAWTVAELRRHRRCRHRRDCCGRYCRVGESQIESVGAGAVAAAACAGWMI